MPEFKPGKFVWFECLTTDPDVAGSFYAELLGWTIEPVDVGGFRYPMIKTGADHRAIGAILPVRDGGPSHWISYLSVSDVDGAAAAVVRSGGELFGKSSEMAGVGEMIRVADPHGAHLFLFKSADGDAQDGDTQSGGFYWNELWTRDGDEAASFYEAVVPWIHETIDAPGGRYRVASSQGKARAGVMSSPLENVPPMWLPYVRVDDVDDRVARAEALGAEVIAPLAELPELGTTATLRDPTGSVFAMITPATSPM